MNLAGRNIIVFGAFGSQRAKSRFCRSKEISVMVEGVEEGLIASAHDISEGVWRPLWLKCVLGARRRNLGQI